MMLICAVLASLALGVLMAYGICMTMFRVFRVQTIAAAQQRAHAAMTSALRIATEG